MAEASSLNRYCQRVCTQVQTDFQPLQNNAFKCTIQLPDHDHTAHGIAQGKKAAQLQAVRDMVSFLQATGLLQPADQANTSANVDAPAAKKRKVAAAPPAPLQAEVAQHVPAAALAASSPAPAKQASAPPQPVVEDGMGNFTLEVARGQLNQQLKKWKQPTEMTLTPVGPDHQRHFKASLRFHISKLGLSFNESHVAANKKQVQNELALMICRKLYQKGLIPKYARSAKKGTFWDHFKAGKYFESGSFGMGLLPHVKGRLRDYLMKCGYTVPQPDDPPPDPGQVLWEGPSSSEVSQQLQPISAVPWHGPCEGQQPWPPPKRNAERDEVAATLMAEASSTLPIASRYDEICATIARNQITIIQGSTGSGKTTQVPQYVLDYDDGQGPKNIIVTQPRRLAAITVARRVAAERGESLGGSVGYAVRFDQVWPQRPGGILYMTSGLLLKRLHQRGLGGVSHVIVDEVHERDLDNDLLLGLLRAAANAHRGLKVILMSATINTTKFQQYMSASQGGPAGGLPPVLCVEGRCHEVETVFLEDVIEKLKWTPPAQRKEKDPREGSLNTCDQGYYSPSTVQALHAMHEQQIPLELARDLLASLVADGTVSHTSGSVLIFMPTWGMMSLLARLIQAEPALSQACKVIMLHSQVPKDEQMEAFKPPPPGLAKVIIATNLAESSVTIDDVTCVIDSCKVKLTFFSETTRLSYNDVVWTGRQNLEQRKGRAGRTRPGICFRLCSRRRFMEGLEDEVPAELTRMPLVGAALLVKSLDVGEVASVLGQCPDAPPEAAVAHAITELQLVRALDAEQNLTPVGRILGRLPVDPHVGLALLMGHWFFGLGDVMAIMCAAMSFDEPFDFAKTAGYLPWSIQERYKGTHKHSDQFVLAMVHQEYARLMSGPQGELAASRFCTSENLHPAIMRQVYDASKQLRGLLTSEAMGGLMVPAGTEEVEAPLDAPLEPPAFHAAVRDWSQQEWQWGAVQLLLATALPHVAVHQEKRQLWVSEENYGAVHKGSVNCSKGAYVFPSPLFAFLDQVKEGGWKPPRCRQLTSMPPLLTILRPFACGDVSLHAEDANLALVAGWIPVGPVQPDTVQLLLFLRCRIEDALVECADKIFQEGGAAFAEGGGLQDFELKKLLQDLLRHGSLRHREDPQSQGSADAWRTAATQAAWKGGGKAKGKGFW
eukprot:TRINITY_DN22997_c0_g1_i1.p1 TRINITY_DN22997_c0_g1~~TRINITY_DN22997_c0_g1_i1.p1  ORF type:complete len:1174 (+),score=255.17 TRINITY_DN22997_c0_g1_i1:48-3569(+)